MIHWALEASLYPAIRPRTYACPPARPIPPEGVSGFWIRQVGFNTFVLLKRLPGRISMLPRARNNWSGAVSKASLLLPPTSRRLQTPARPTPPEGMSGFWIRQVCLCKPYSCKACPGTSRIQNPDISSGRIERVRAGGRAAAAKLMSPAPTQLFRFWAG